MSAACFARSVSRTLPRVLTATPASAVTAQRFLASPLLQQQLSVTASTLRLFSSGAGSVESRVIEAVKRYAAMRLEELKNEGDNSSDKDKMMAALSSDVTASTKWSDLGFDDLDQVEVLLEVEDEFNHVIPDDAADSIQSVQESIDYIEKAVN
mmetsp:Transcript_13313/g.29105  ORF Transcript_13313/g.29105 Transcript_13313/m.29105 type:complete len:153 (-) Transcript_13313:206-664(-)|eukprot:CAMPEP_0206503794 /NCGR_PEP_ID=MMETSP0324_2-20121206/55002_1 /ASSEMBLY_ACC=CAM_ASM_000836 /TAXON_ID=2866 /ORGANISM="Crypthecodinium cohnii, Strain Seligo" /LENGTH=152 /DNA_ID=CAMNT_0053992641 /DNA_START=95 /DNA_END=553 /DNA_ORIENTATION=+